jgi:hypothetical protein
VEEPVDEVQLPGAGHRGRHQLSPLRV